MMLKTSQILTQFAVLSLGASFLVTACGSSDDDNASSAGSSSGGATHAGGAGTAGAKNMPQGGAGDADSGAGGAPQTGDSGSTGTIGAAGAAGADGNDGEVQYVADLEGYSQNPRIVTTATGSATLSLSADKKTLSYHVIQNVTNATKAHIHLGAAGENGAVVYPLEPLSADMTGSITLTGATDLDNLDGGKFISTCTPRWMPMVRFEGKSCIRTRLCTWPR
jgi:hypothetical protein